MLRITIYSTDKDIAMDIRCDVDIDITDKSKEMLLRYAIVTVCERVRDFIADCEGEIRWDEKTDMYGGE